MGELGIDVHIHEQTIYAIVILLPSRLGIVATSLSELSIFF